MGIPANKYYALVIDKFQFRDTSTWGGVDVWGGPPDAPLTRKNTVVAPWCGQSIDIKFYVYGQS